MFQFYIAPFALGIDLPNKIGYIYIYILTITSKDDEVSDYNNINKSNIVSVYDFLILMKSMWDNYINKNKIIVIIIFGEKNGIELCSVEIKVVTR